jgi:hypothetical protein
MEPLSSEDNTSYVSPTFSISCASTAGIRCGGDTRHVASERRIRVAEVQLLSSKNHTLSLGMKIGGAKPHEGWAAPHAYLEDTYRKALKWALLSRDSFP